MKKKILSSISIIFCGFFSFGSSVFAASLAQCGNVNNIPSKLPYFVWLAFTLIKYITPVLIIVLGSLDFFKAITANDSDMLAKTFKVFGKRLIAGVVVFLVFILFQTTISLVAKKSTGFTQCLSCFLTDPDQCTVDTTTGVTTTPVNEDDIIDGYNNSQTEFDEDTYSKEIIDASEYAKAKIDTIDISEEAIGCATYTGTALKTTIEANSLISKQMTTIFKEVCKYLKSNKSVDYVGINTAGTYNMGSSTSYPHNYAMGIDLFSIWHYTKGSTTYNPYAKWDRAGYNTSLTLFEYKKFICDVCNGDETCPENINYQIYEKIFKPKGWCWGGNWGPTYFDPMHFEVMKTSETSCSTSNKVKITCN